MKKTKLKLPRQKDVLGMKRSRKKLKQTAGFVMDVGVAGMIIQTAKGLK